MVGVLSHVQEEIVYALPHPPPSMAISHSKGVGYTVKPPAKGPIFPPVFHTPPPIKGVLSGGGELTVVVPSNMCLICPCKL